MIMWYATYSIHHTVDVLDGIHFLGKKSGSPSYNGYKTKTKQRANRDDTPQERKQEYLENIDEVITRRRDRKNREKMVDPSWSDREYFRGRREREEEESEIPKRQRGRKEESVEGRQRKNTLLRCLRFFFFLLM